MAEDKRRQFRPLELQLKVEKTEARNGAWVTSGHVSVDVVRGDDFSTGSLTLPFVDAASRDEAMNQAVQQLKLVQDAIAKYLSVHQKPPEPANEAA